MFFRMFLPSTDKVKRKIEILQSNGVFILVTNQPDIPLGKFRLFVARNEIGGPHHEKSSAS